MVEGAPGHGEGHNSGQAVNIVAALAVKDLMEREQLPGTLVIWPGVAEELLGGKAYMVRAGMFKDVDAVLFTHVGDNFSTSWGQPQRHRPGLGRIHVPRASPRTLPRAPWRGRNALRAVELMNIGWDFRREQLRPEQRSHYVITNGGDQPNVIAAARLGLVFLPRDGFREHQEELRDRQQDRGRGRDDDRHHSDAQAGRHRGAAPLQQADRRGDAGQHRRRSACPQWTDEEQTFAKAVQKLTQRRGGRARAPSRPRSQPPARKPESGGSDDIGDVSWVVPTAPLFYPSNIPNLPGHNWANAIAMATPDRPQGQPRRLQGDGA